MSLIQHFSQDQQDLNYSRVRNKHRGMLINFWIIVQGLRPYESRLRLLNFGFFPEATNKNFQVFFFIMILHILYRF